jgi:hypothetical protein
MALTDTAVRNAKPKAKPYKVTDSEGPLPAGEPQGQQAMAGQIPHQRG